MPVRFSLTAQQQTPVHGSAGSGSCLFIEASPEVGQRCAEAGRRRGEGRDAPSEPPPLWVARGGAEPPDEPGGAQPRSARASPRGEASPLCWSLLLSAQVVSASLSSPRPRSPQISPDLPYLSPHGDEPLEQRRDVDRPSRHLQGGARGRGGRVQRSVLDCSPEERHTRGTDRALAGSAKPTVHSPPGRLPEGGICSGEQARLRRHGRKSARCCSCPSQVRGVPLQHAARRSPRRQTGCRRRASDELEGGRGERATRRGRRRATARRVGVEGELEADHLETAPR